MQLELAGVQKEESDEMVKKLQQEAKDGVEDRKISERKGHSMVKDLKRQLQAEKKRTERLQERLREWAETTSNMSDPPSQPLEADRSSTSSWSLMSGHGAIGEGPLASSPLPTYTNSEDPSPPDVSSPPLEEENETLMARVATLQQEKWALEERLAMLEQSGAAMAEELVAKSELVKQYCITAGGRRSLGSSQSGLLSSPNGEKGQASRMMEKLDRLVKSENVQHAKEVSSMQSMLEETLMKNLHLQQDLERMSQEIVRLSKLAGSPTSDWK